MTGRVLSALMHDEVFQQDKMLQAWVQHGERVSTRTGELLGKISALHDAASSEMRSVGNGLGSLSTIIGDRSAADWSRISPFIARDRSKRATARNLRRKFREALTAAEQAENKARARIAAEADAAAMRKKMENERKAAAAAAAQKELEEKHTALRKRQMELAAAQASRERLQRQDTQAGDNARRFGYTGYSTPNASVSSTVVGRTQSTALDSKQSGRQVQSLTTNKASPAKGVRGGSSNQPGLKTMADWPSDVQRTRERWAAVCKSAELFRGDARMKKPRIALRKRINLVANQVAASKRQVTANVSTLVAVVRDARNAGAQAEDFVVKEIAERLVAEGAGPVALSTTAAFAVAYVIVGVCAHVPDTEKMCNSVLGALYDACMYTAPKYVYRQPGESNEEYAARFGYKQDEKFEDYVERMCGYVRLMGAIYQTDYALPINAFGSGVRNPITLDGAWRWLARILNGKQKSITPAITFAFLEVAGYSMSQTYRRQFAKLMDMVRHVVIERAVPAAPPGPKSRLDSLCDEFNAGQQMFLRPPKGKTLPESDAINRL